MSCNNMVGFIKCGSIGGSGTVELCVDCLRYAEKLYPYGWNVVPDDRCKHGVNIRPSDGRDGICGHCESE